MTREPMNSAPAGGGEPRGCDVADLAVFHGFLLTLFDDAQRWVTESAEAPPRHVARMTRHLDHVVAILHDHHHGEDLVLWDRLSGRAPGCALHVDAMRRQHESIAARAEALSADVERWRETASEPERQRVVASLEALVSELREHLGQEENVIAPVAAVELTQSEWDELAEHGRRAVPRERLLLQLGLMLDALSPDDAAHLLASLPAPVRMMWAAFGVRVYRRQRARLERRSPSEAA
ncbi:hemerythrin domain-containing protein [Aeromicrobium sp. YIM 150415]|uniref:hemerythrin domain-containing protein n=1 Tax=Aeromicrobium sp. YIM 150415 TaxID=2803912 RepID=UPI00196286F3|nr:hemerythrin domain-containing protein [Aeromicrobium sp. YIM 150415]MBM9462224.1 hemerythrin domain-containing protein [Aeromicrobium sp. YIM 150415]